MWIGKVMRNSSFRSETLFFRWRTSGGGVPAFFCSGVQMFSSASPTSYCIFLRQPFDAPLDARGRLTCFLLLLVNLFIMEFVERDAEPAENSSGSVLCNSFVNSFFYHFSLCSLICGDFPELSLQIISNQGSAVFRMKLQRSVKRNTSPHG